MLVKFIDNLEIEDSFILFDIVSFNLLIICVLAIDNAAI